VDSFLIDKGSPRYLHGNSTNSHGRNSLAASMIGLSHLIGMTLF
jgi:hypothetical protein